MQKSDLEQGDGGGFLAQVRHQFAVEHAEERGRNQRAQVVEQNGLGVEPQVSRFVGVGGRVVGAFQHQLSRNS